MFNNGYMPAWVDYVIKTIKNANLKENLKIV